MIEPADEELLNREVDGQNSPEESALLRERLSGRAEVRARYEELRKLVQVLEQVGQVDTPAGLAGEVMRRIREKERPQGGGWLEALRGAFQRPPALRYALTFAAGLLLGTAVVALLGQSPPLSRLERSSLSGTILPESQLGRAETVDRDRFAVGEVRGEAVTRRSDGLVLVEIQLAAVRPIDLLIEFDRDSLSPVGFERSGPSGSDVVLGSGQVRLRHAGEARYLLVMRESGGSPSPLRVRFKGEGVLFERTLKTRRGRS